MAGESAVSRRYAGVLGGLTAAALVLGTASSGAASPPAAPPATAAATSRAFVRRVDNPYYPLVPGTTYVYKGVRDGRSQVDRVTVLHRTKEIQGVTTTVVRDVARHGRHLIEKTFDWFAQDEGGTVWYFGENTKEYDRSGHVVSTEGSWTSGVDGARRGIIMEAHPAPADGYRQEYYAGHAEDQAWILSRGTSLTVPYGHLHDVLRTMEWSRLEPRVVDEKYYARGIGIVYEVTVAGGEETAQLVKIVS